MTKQILKSEDVLILLKLAASYPYELTPDTLSYETGHTIEEVETSVERLQVNGLVDTVTCRIKMDEFLKFILHEVQKLFSVQPGKKVRGLLTGAKPNNFFAVGLPYESIWVWPHPDGKHMGFGITPLSPHCSFAASNDSRLRVLLAVTETMRIVGTPARSWASEELKQFMTAASFKLNPSF